MALTNSKTQAALKERRQVAYKTLKTLAIAVGIMQHWKDSNGYDEFIKLLENGEFELKFVDKQEK